MKDLILKNSSFIYVIIQFNSNKNDDKNQHKTSINEAEKKIIMVLHGTFLSFLLVLFSLMAGQLPPPSHGPAASLYVKDD